MSGIFGDETITPEGISPEDGQEMQGAVDPESENPDIEREDDFEESDSEESDADEVEGEEEEDAPPEGQGDNGLILGKFKTQEDLAKAYLNLQAEFTRQRMQQSGGQQQSQQPQMPAQQQGGQPDVQQLFWERFKVDPIGAIQAVAQYVAQQQTAPLVEERRTAAVSQSLEAVAKEYRQIQTPEGMKQLFERVNEIAQELGNPALAQHPTQRVLRMAASELWGDTKAQVYQKAKQAGRVEAERTRQSKVGLAAQGGARRPLEGEKTTEQEIKEAILAAGKGGGLFG
mgnify:CR=1 FL=1